MQSNALSGVRVLDLSRLLPGPHATQLLAQMGAEVIKIERTPLGDYARGMPPFIALGQDQFEGAVFAQNNRHKKSVAIDFDTARGRELVLSMSEGADVFVESFRPNMLARRGLDYASVRERNPRIIYCSLSGYGQTGEYAARAGHDLNYMALAGILKLNGEREKKPMPLPIQMADLAGGMEAALRIAAALVERERTGVGSFLDVSLYGAALDWMQTVNGAVYRAEGENPQRGMMPLAGAYPCYNVYETSDGEFMALGALEPIFWKAFCIEAGRSELIDGQFDDEAIPRVAEVFRERSRAEWTEFSKRVDCCLEPLLSVSEALEQPLAGARNPINLDGRAPRLGQDTEAVLEQLGVSREQVEELRGAGVIGE